MLTRILAATALALSVLSPQAFAANKDDICGTDNKGRNDFIECQDDVQANKTVTYGAGVVDVGDVDMKKFNGDFVDETSSDSNQRSSTRN